MSTNKYNWTEEDFDRYLAGEMDTSERMSFDNDILANPDLSVEFNDHKHTIEFVKKAFRREAFTQKIRKIHTSHFQQLASLKKRDPFIKRLLRFSSNVAAAAVIAAIVTLSIFYAFDKFGFDKTDFYMELRNEFDDIHSKQEFLKRELKKNRPIPVLFTGTSFAVSSDGLLATNYHVIRDIDSVWVSNNADSLVRYKAKIVYRNARYDIALLQITDTLFTGFGRLPYNIFANEAEMGEYVYTLGYSKQDIVFGEGSISSTSGHNSDTTAYQISTPVNPGNSGGPLFDSEGNLLGMISGKNISKDGVGFAIKSHYITYAIDELTDLLIENPPTINSSNQLSGKTRPEQLKILQPLIFRVQIVR